MLRSVFKSNPAFCALKVLNMRQLSSSNTELLRKAKPESLGQTYMRWLETYPLKTKALSSGVIAGLGDILCQVGFENKSMFSAGDGNKGSEFGWRRFFVFSALGGLYLGPALHMWYRVLGRVLPGTTQLAVAKRLAADQFVFAPVFIPSFMSLTLILQGKIADVPKKLADAWWPTVKANWAVWIPAQYINFSFVSPNLQVLFANCVGLVWHVYLSKVSNNDNTPAAADI
ncbi:hypothetical protein SARC_03530 [Sphaeroforma arctica JP610]|uniref:Protein SYM1 n=1 Tax=Sphaeroforma arctica JP610 TaxID=667725 RepID=A0A0L0G5N4_9EUKA|nr:hypothetical protein SARC_03530 [Sphaeroforma arctica JP610]KNC84259.1 hypothetical protein SARC_03530 [Sphaeroforma arctica JP610]|eukprot:XP_014158161.1 hypothetical protein SARC_03530 [Sphaeroforma arctica JP610]